MIFNILDNTTELWMTKYIIGEIFSSGRATLYMNRSDQTVKYVHLPTAKVILFSGHFRAGLSEGFFINASRSAPSTNSRTT